MTAKKKKVAANPRISSRKKPPPKTRKDFATAKEYNAWKKRSQASKEGWKKREAAGDTVRAVESRLRAQILEFIERTEERDRKLNKESIRKGRSPKIIIPEPLPKKPSLEQIVERAKYHSDNIPFAGWVDAVDDDYLHKDRTLALMPSRLRHQPLTPVWEEILERAGKKGNKALKRQAEVIAEMYEVDLKEVYTLFFSP
jgi:hypothetical protein